MENRCNYIKGCLCLVMMCIVIFLTGCRVEETQDKKLKDLDYTICDEGKLPDALVELVQEKKKEPFKLTYRTRDYLYIVMGYGAQDRTDLSISLEELYLTENAIFIDTQLNALESTTLENEKLSYPWIAVKCDLYDVQVIFK